MDKIYQTFPNTLYSNNPQSFNPQTANQGNFQTVFNNAVPIQTNGYDPKGQFINHNFTNKNEILHNNLNSILLNEEIREYSVMIDSKDRNYQVYPDPFNYEVKFHPLPKTREKVNGKMVTYEEPAPTINDNFTNVRYIKLEEAIMPLYYKVKQNIEIDDDGDETKRWIVDTNKKLTDNLYMVLSLGGEYSDENYRSTNDVLGGSFTTIYYDCLTNSTHYFGYTSNGVKIFPQDQLGKIDRLRITFMDPYGKPIRVPHVNKKILSNMECNCIDPEGDDDTDCYKHNLFHPLNPIFQHHLHFKIGVVEPRLSKMTFS